MTDDGRSLASEQLPLDLAEKLVEDDFFFLAARISRRRCREGVAHAWAARHRDDQRAHAPRRRRDDQDCKQRPSERASAPEQNARHAPAVWVASYFGWVPKLGLMKPPTRDRPDRSLVMLGAHLIFGGVLGKLSER